MERVLARASLGVVGHTDVALLGAGHTRVVSTQGATFELRA
jgi:hypothetical protein